MPKKTWEFKMEDFNHFRKILKEKKFNDRLVDDKVKIIPEREEDKLVAEQLENMINTHLSEDS